jgi:hypothetical protein
MVEIDSYPFGLGHLSGALDQDRTARIKPERVLTRGVRFPANFSARAAQVELRRRCEDLWAMARSRRCAGGQGKLE